MSELTMDQIMAMQEIKLLRELDSLTGLLQVLVFLAKFERGNISHFIKDLRLNQQPIYRTLEKMIELGLVEVKQEPLSDRRNFKSKFYYLTDNGRMVASPLVELFETYREMRL